MVESSNKRSIKDCLDQRSLLVSAESGVFVGVVVDKRDVEEGHIGVLEL
jgi:hypothetical protein